jgi:hypothetical protein
MITASSNAYEHDFYAWLKQHATFLREGNINAVDIDNIAEELEGMSRLFHYNRPWT